MKRVLITGASGFVGANLARRMISDGHDVRLIVRPGYTSWRVDSIRPNVQLYEVDLEDREGVTGVVKSIRPDWVFHLATYGAYSWQTDLDRMVRANIGGFANLIDACLQTGFDVMVNTGSSSEYGFKDHPAREDERLEPNSYYALTKAAATHLAAYMAHSKSARILTLRLYSAYGLFEEPRRLMPTLIVKGVEGKLPSLVSPQTARDYVYIDDVVEAYKRAALQSDAPSDAIYNVASGAQVTLAEVVDIARRVLSIPDAPNWETMPSRQWDTDAWVGDPCRIDAELGWKAATSLEQGFKAMTDWLRSDPAMLTLYQQSILRPPDRASG